MQLAFKLLPVLLPSFLGATFFVRDFPEETQRPWPGPEYFANRMLDWQVKAGRLECLTDNKGKPMRTVHRLTHFASEKPGILEMEVLTGTISLTSNTKPSLNTWTGFLIGVGGDHVDFRISALCHHWPAQDGGLIVAIDGTGQVVIRSNTATQKLTDLSNPDKAWPRLAGKAIKGPAFGNSIPGKVRLHLKAPPHENGKTYRIAASARTFEGELIHQFNTPEVDSKLVDGNLALVSHHSSSMNGHGYWFRDWKASGTKLREDPGRALGPVFAAQYTLSRGILKLTAQLPALGKQDSQEAELHIRPGQGEHWRKATTGKLHDHSFTIPFRVENWDSSREHAYRVVYKVRTGPDRTDIHHFEGTIRKDPAQNKDFKLAAFTGHHISAQGAGNWNQGSIWYPHNELTTAIEWHDPDLLFFSGDQIYSL